VARAGRSLFKLNLPATTKDASSEMIPFDSDTLEPPMLSLSVFTLRPHAPEQNAANTATPVGSGVFSKTYNGSIPTGFEIKGTLPQSASTAGSSVFTAMDNIAIVVRRNALPGSNRYRYALTGSASTTTLQDAGKIMNLTWDHGSYIDMDETSLPIAFGAAAGPKLPAAGKAAPGSGWPLLDGLSLKLSEMLSLVTGHRPPPDSLALAGQPLPRDRLALKFDIHLLLGPAHAALKERNGLDADQIRISFAPTLTSPKMLAAKLVGRAKTTSSTFTGTLEASAFRVDQFTNNYLPARISFTGSLSDEVQTLTGKLESTVARDGTDDSALNDAGRDFEHAAMTFTGTQQAAGRPPLNLVLALVRTGANTNTLALNYRYGHNVSFIGHGKQDKLTPANNTLTLSNQDGVQLVVGKEATIRVTRTGGTLATITQGPIKYVDGVSESLL
jgi:hypothetical protein